VGRCSGAAGVRRWNKFVRPVSVRALVDAAHEVDVAHSGAREAEGLEHVEHLRGSRADLLAADGPVEAGVPMRSPVMRSFLPTCQRRKRQWQSQLAATDRYAEPRRQLRAADPVLGRLVDEHPDFDPRAMLAERPQRARDRPTVASNAP
jgi:hypothetical protein